MSSQPWCWFCGFSNLEASESAKISQTQTNGCSNTQGMWIPVRWRDAKLVNPAFDPSLLMSCESYTWSLIQNTSFWFFRTSVPPIFWLNLLNLIETSHWTSLEPGAFFTVLLLHHAFCLPISSTIAAWPQPQTAQIACSCSNLQRCIAQQYGKKNTSDWRAPCLMSIDVPFYVQHFWVGWFRRKTTDVNKHQETSTNFISFFCRCLFPPEHCIIHERPSDPNRQAPSPKLDNSQWLEDSTLFSCIQTTPCL